jgi:hypothetical protein
VLPSKLWEVVTSYFPQILQPETSAGDQTRKNKSADIRSKSLGSAEPKEAVEEQEEDYDISSRHMLPGPGLENEQSSHVDSDEQFPSDESTGQVTAVGSETDEKGDVKAGVNATSGDDGAAWFVSIQPSQAFVILKSGKILFPKLRTTKPNIPSLPCVASRHSFT